MLVCFVFFKYRIINPKTGFEFNCGLTVIVSPLSTVLTCCPSSKINCDYNTEASGDIYFFSLVDIYLQLATFILYCLYVLCAGDGKPPTSGPPPGEFEGGSSRPQEPSNPSGPSDIPPNKPAWYDPQHMGPWNPNQPVNYSIFILCIYTFFDGIDSSF